MIIYGTSDGSEPGGNIKALYVSTGGTMPSADLINALYKKFLQRSATTKEIQDWLDMQAITFISLEGIAEQLQWNPEFQHIYPGILPQHYLTHDDFVKYTAVPYSEYSPYHLFDLADQSVFLQEVFGTDQPIFIKQITPITQTVESMQSSRTAEQVENAQIAQMSAPVEIITISDEKIAETTNENLIPADTQIPPTETLQVFGPAEIQTNSYIAPTDSGIMDDVSVQTMQTEQPKKKNWVIPLSLIALALNFLT